MKYLKNFKENKDEYYVECTPTDINAIRISKQTIEYLSQFKDLTCISNVYPKDELSIFNTSTGKKIVELYELPDEYFMVYVKKTAGYFGTWYKCDQLDGVKELFIDRGIIGTGVNESNKEDYYVDITGESTSKLIPINISKQSINYILSLFPDISLNDNKMSGTSKYRQRGFRYELASSYNGKDYIIIYLNSDYYAHIIEVEDEYFLVTIVMYSDDYSIKCDQLDGVKELFEDIHSSSFDPSELNESYTNFKLPESEENKDNFYIVTYDEYSKNNNYENCINISTQSIKYIKNLFKKQIQNLLRFEVQNVCYEESQWFRMITISMKYNFITGSGKISKKDIALDIVEKPDEYFHVEFYIIGNKDSECYICDQLDGVKELLIDKKLI